MSNKPIKQQTIKTSSLFTDQKLIENFSYRPTIVGCTNLGTLRSETKTIV